MTKNGLKKLAIWLFGITFLLFFSLYLFSKIYLDPLLTDKVHQAFNKATKGYYHLTFSKLHIGLIGGNLKIKGIEISPDSLKLRTEPAATTLNFSAKELKISGLSYLKLFREQVLKIGKIKLIEPHVFLLQQKGKKQAKDTAKQGKPTINEVLIKKIEIIDGYFKFQDKTKKRLTLELNKFAFKIEAFRLPIAEKLNTKIPFESREIYVQLSDILYNKAKDLYRYKVKNFEFSYKKSEVKIDSLQVLPKYSKYAFAKQLGYRKDWQKMLVKSLKISKLEIDSLIEKNKLMIQRLDVSGLVFQVFGDKRLREKKRNKKMPQQALRAVKQYFRIDTISLKKSYIAYSERHAKAPKAGSIFLNAVQAEITNLTNDRALLKKNSNLKVRVQSKLMGKAKLKLKLDFDLLDKNDSHHLELALSSMDLSRLNSMLEHTAFVKIKQGSLKKLFANFSINRQAAKGRVQMHYNDLKISILNKEKKDKKDKKFVSFLLNNTLIRSDNPSKNKPPREGEIYFKRDRNRSIVNYWVKAILQGIGQTVAPKVVKKTSKKKKKKKWWKKR